jgi:hypothetical protein
MNFSDQRVPDDETECLLAGMQGRLLRVCAMQERTSCVSDSGSSGRSVL